MQELPTWQNLRGIKRADVAVVGGGLTGVMTALLLSRGGLSVVLTEAGQLGQGASFACGGLLTAQLGRAYLRAVDAAGEEVASVYARLMQQAVHGVRTLIDDERIACDAIPQTVMTYATDEAEARWLDILLDKERRIGLPVEPAADAGDCPVPVRKAIAIRHQGVLSPTKLVRAMAEVAVQKGCRIYERSPARTVEDGIVYTPMGHIEASTVVLTTGVPIGCKDLSVLSMLEQRVAASCLLRGGVPSFGSHLSVDIHGLNMRPVEHEDGLLLWGDMGRAGSRHREALTDRFARMTRSLLADWREERVSIRQAVWSADGMPLIGAVNKGNGGVLMASGYGGMGLTNAYLAANILSRQMLGRPMAEAALFQPFRRYDKKTSVMVSGFKKQTSAYAGGLLHPLSPTCPHMGCKLRYSAEARRWECPCHGSAFGILGEVVNAPASEDAKIARFQHPYQ